MSLDASARSWLTEVTSGRVRYDEPMSLHTSFRVGGPAEAFVEPKTEDELAALVSGISDREISYLVVGGTNLIVSDTGISGIVICLKSSMSEMIIEATSSSRVSVTAMAGTSLRLFCSRAIRKGLGGMNFALGIPGTVGGAICMNAGTAMGWISDVLEAITVLYPNGLRETIHRNALESTYRKLMLPQLPGGKPFSHLSHQTIILSGRFSLTRANATDLIQDAREILKNRKRRQPVNLPSAGCIFKNPLNGKTAGALIDLCGLKGQRIGGAEISSKHANFIVNTGSASAADILALMEYMREIVLERFLVDLEPEVIVIGN